MLAARDEKQAQRDGEAAAHLLVVSAPGGVSYAGGQPEERIVLLQQSQLRTDALALSRSQQHIGEHPLRLLLRLEKHTSHHVKCIVWVANSFSISPAI